ncbi:MAG: hypothetical protein ACRDNL_21860 [Spirillospora sp.]
MTMTDRDVQAGPPDTGPLLAEYRAIVIPATADFLDNRLTATALRDLWRKYYFDAFRRYDLTVERSWRKESGTDGRIDSGPPTADPTLTTPLTHFPVSIAHNNLDRLIEVLSVELGDRTAEHTQIHERLVDYAHIVNELDTLMASLAA